MSYIAKKRDALPPMPTGDYLAMLEDYEVLPSKFDPNKESVKLLFGIVAPQDYAGRRLSMYVTPIVAPKTKFTKIAAALLGNPPSDDLDLDELLQKRAVLTVTVTDAADGQFNRIAEVRAPRPTPPARPAPATQAQRPAAPASKPTQAPAPVDDDDGWWEATLQSEQAALADTSSSVV